MTRRLLLVNSNKMALLSLDWPPVTDSETKIVGQTLEKVGYYRSSNRGRS